MKNLMKRGLALLLALVWCVTLLPTFEIHSEAAEVEYVYSGKYIYNWGTRGTVATFLSPNAEKFYDNHASYDALSAYSGGTGTSDAPNSALYKALQKLMTDAHSYITSYDATRDLYKYTDCQNSGGKISSFYSGKEIGPSWDKGATWNREHTWPNSKGEGDGENDIMMLRPTSVSENSSRGNKAYGKSSGFYNPNNASGGTYDLRGDVARIFLYVYVRWGNLSYAWGSGGVMESLDVMLEWIEADPVDTWELGRNDSVESITGTRNVFVDYPELAFLLFGEDIPENMSTPSGEGSNKCDHNNFGTTVVAATCDAKGYTLYTCKVSGCGYSYKANYTNAKDHNYVSGTCSLCGAKEAVKPTYATSVAAGKAYKLGFYSDAAGMEYYFTGAMSGYYGATDGDQTKGVDVYVETATGGYYLYFKDSSNKKQYINLVLATGSDGKQHYNFTFGTTASSVYTWDSAKNALTTKVSGEPCYIGTYGTYQTMSVLTSTKYKDTDYVARMYTTDGSGSTGGTTPAPCTHKYTSVVVKPNCISGGFTTYTCSLCGDTYTGDKTNATGHKYSSGKCTVCGATQSTSTSGSSATISFADTANRTEFSTSKQVWKQNGITVTNNKSSASSPIADYSNPGRFYKGSEVVIEYPGITKLEINCEGIKEVNKYIEGWLSAPSGATATRNGDVVTLVFSSPVNSVTYSSLASQSRAMSITVYTGDGSGSSTPTCSHTNTTIEGAKAPTCTVDGHTGKIKCTSCKQIINEGAAIKAIGHNWTPADCDNPKTCTKCQETEGSSLGHDFDANNICTRCGASEGGKLPEDTTTDGTVTADPDETTDGTDTTVPDVTGPSDTTDVDKKKDNDKNNNLVLPIIIGVVAVAAIGAVVTVIIIKKKK